MTDVVSLAAEYGRAIGLPCARRAVARAFNLFPVRWPEGWRVYVPVLGCYVADDALDNTLLQSDPEAFIGIIIRRVGREPFERLPLLEETPVRPVRPLYRALQPLADEVAGYVDAALRWFWEGDGAPELPVFPDAVVGGVSDEHVRRAVEAMQPEVDQETNRIHQAPYPGQRYANYGLRLADLPWERQRRLVEARRFVFYRYGITGRNFQTRTWSYLEVPCTCSACEK